jgi:hypothetical protein
MCRRVEEVPDTSAVARRFFIGGRLGASQRRGGFLHGGENRGVRSRQLFSIGQLTPVFSSGAPDLCFPKSG